MRKDTDTLMYIHVSLELFYEILYIILQIFLNNLFFVNDQVESFENFRTDVLYHKVN